MNQEVIDQKARITSTITSMLSMHRGEIAPTLGERLFGETRDATRQAEHMLEAHGTLLESSLGKVQEAHKALIDEAADDEPYRVKRQELSDALTQALVTTRNLVEAAYGEDAVRHFDMHEEIPQSGEQIYHYTAQVIELMTQRPIMEPSPHGFDLDFGPIAQKLRAHLDPLAKVLEDIRREAREIREAIDALKSSTEDFDETYVAVSEAVHAFYLLARRPDLAAMLQRTHA